ncbi:hypothetical protein N7462_001020 [Penicillium macrosclerotiorum]|uniref:uncharacterized protein n=1 Tax=Penicillium macrosclerotiorum TaxID=303699 RepID=UPI002548EC20|nr:uncharacterized protein N7462_001020 [Penicillium macrosclerotiorum]KAJ5699015.1 hypothetical protein N7462_001020 [Penicillium macrosclerotiorum]
MESGPNEPIDPHGADDPGQRAISQWGLASTRPGIRLHLLRSGQSPIAPAAEIVHGCQSPSLSEATAPSFQNADPDRFLCLKRLVPSCFPVAVVATPTTAFSNAVRPDYATEIFRRTKKRQETGIDGHQIPLFDRSTAVLSGTFLIGARPHGGRPPWLTPV